MKRLLKLIVILIILLVSSKVSAIIVPLCNEQINDYARILSPQTKHLLNSRLKEHEDSTTNQVVILTIPTIYEEDIETYAYTVFNEWKLGQKNKDNGVLIVIALNDRTMRIEVGYGLEGVLTDLMANRIIRNVMTPKFKNDDYEGGITEGVTAIIELLDGEDLSDQLRDEDNNLLKSFINYLDSADWSFDSRIILGFFFFGLIGLFTFSGILAPTGAYYFYLFLLPFWATCPILIFGANGGLICLYAYLIIFPVSNYFIQKSDWYKNNVKAKLGNAKNSSGGMDNDRSRSSSSSSFSSSSSSGSSSGSSGGGGRSGGGGSSGRW